MRVAGLKPMKRSAKYAMGFVKLTSKRATRLRGYLRRRRKGRGRGSPVSASSKQHRSSHHHLLKSVRKISRTSFKYCSLSLSLCPEPRQSKRVKPESLTLAERKASSGIARIQVMVEGPLMSAALRAAAAVKAGRHQHQGWQQQRREDQRREDQRRKDRWREDRRREDRRREDRRREDRRREDRRREDRRREDRRREDRRREEQRRNEQRTGQRRSERRSEQWRFGRQVLLRRYQSPHSDRQQADGRASGLVTPLSSHHSLRLSSGRRSGGCTRSSGLQLLSGPRIPAQLALDSCLRLRPR